MNDNWVHAAIGAAILYVVSGTLAHAASMEYCHPYADAVTRVVHATVGDTDVDQYIHDRAYSTCINADENPGIPFITGVTDEPPGTVQATTDSPHVAACRAGWPRSYDEATDTVRRNGRGPRVPCPVD